MGDCYCAECCSAEFDGEPGVRVAVDIDGELTELEQAVRAVDRAYLLTAAATWARIIVEQDIEEQHPGWLDRSKRLGHLERAADELRHAALELSRAMAASGTKTDEIPF